MRIRCGSRRGMSSSGPTRSSGSWSREAGIGRTSRRVFGPRGMCGGSARALPGSEGPGLAAVPLNKHTQVGAARAVIQLTTQRSSQRAALGAVPQLPPRSHPRPYQPHVRPIVHQEDWYRRQQQSVGRLRCEDLSQVVAEHRHELGADAAVLASVHAMAVDGTRGGNTTTCPFPVTASPSPCPLNRK